MLELMNSRAAISGLVAPTGREASDLLLLGVRSLRVSSTRLRALTPEATSSSPRPVRERVGAGRFERLERGCELNTRVAAPVPTSEPLPVEQLRPRGATGHRSPQLRERFPVVLLGVGVVAEQRPTTSGQSEIDRTAVGVRSARQPFERGNGRRVIPAPNVGFDGIDRPKWT